MKCRECTQRLYVLQVYYYDETTIREYGCPACDLRHRTTEELDNETYKKPFPKWKAVQIKYDKKRRN